MTKAEAHQEWNQRVNKAYTDAPNNSKVCSDYIGELFYCKDSRSCGKKNHGLAVFEYQQKCVKCIGNVNGWSLYLFLATFPTTVFFLIVFGCGIKATSAPMNALVCFIQIALYSTNLNIDFYENEISNSCDPRLYQRMLRVASVIMDLVSIWNLDFFRYNIPPFCINKYLKTPHILAMEYIGAIYPLVCIAALYICIELHDKDFKPLVILWKPFKKCLSVSCLKNYNPKMSVIEVFATFLLLAYSKLLFTSLNLIAFTTVYTKSSNGSNMSYIASQKMLYDISVPYLGSEHLPFFILAILILFIFNILPLLFLLLYPTKLFQKALGCCTRIRWHPLHAFADAFQGCYKNGTNGTSDCRYFAGLYLLVRAVFCVFGLFVFTDHVTFTVCFILLFHTFSMLIGMARPYRNDLYNKTDLLFFFLIPLPQLWFGVQKNKLGLMTETVIVFFFLIYYFAIATYKILSVCSPRLLEHCKRCYREKKCIPYEFCPKRNGVEDESVNGDDDNDDLLDRLENPQNYQPLVMTTSNEQDHNENTQIDIDSYSNYGTINNY